MFSVRVLTSPERVDDAIASIKGLEGVGNILTSGITRDRGMQVITADVTPGSVDEMLTRIERAGIEPEAVKLVRESSVSAVSSRSSRGWFAYAQNTLVWAETVETARENAALTARYCVYMAVAGAIAACGILLQNAILIVGAMAVSPDLLPLSAFSIGLVGRRPQLAVRGMEVLLIGLTIAGITAAVLAWTLRAFGAYDGLLSSGDVLTGLVNGVTPDTVIVSFAAGVAGMLAFETRASAAVGVAISVTTIPAIAFAGVAVGIGEYNDAIGGLSVLLFNVVVLFHSAALTLFVQRMLMRRRRSR